MILCRRQALHNITVDQAEHAGLWFDKYLSQQLIKGESIATGQKTPQQSLVEECARVDTPDIYGAFFNRWRTALTLCGARVKEAQVQGRLAVGLGDESVIETAVTLHHTYGMPYIPGSALKGLASSFARQRLADAAWRQEGEAYQVLFGNTEGAGFITFFDALYVPGSGHEGQALYPDVITVHHPDYYQQEDVPPADWDNPNPVSFLITTGNYLIALAGPPAWVDATFSILELALVEAGVGAKTSSGYGRLRFLESVASSDESSPTVAEADTGDPEQQKVVASFEQQLAAMPNDKVAGEINAFVQRWRALEIDEPYKQQIAKAIITKIRDAGREKKSSGKKWYQELLASLSKQS
jgi:CRISPR-associated protein Cmr6